MCLLTTLWQRGDGRTFNLYLQWFCVPSEIACNETKSRIFAAQLISIKIYFVAMFYLFESGLNGTVFMALHDLRYVRNLVKVTLNSCQLGAPHWKFRNDVRRNKIKIDADVSKKIYRPIDRFTPNPISYHRLPSETRRAIKFLAEETCDALNSSMDWKFSISPLWVGFVFSVYLILPQIDAQISIRL